MPGGDGKRGRVRLKSYLSMKPWNPEPHAIGKLLLIEATVYPDSTVHPAPPPQTPTVQLH